MADGYKILTLKKWPIVLLPDDKTATIVDPSFLADKFTSGIYWILADARRGSTEKSKQLGAFYGDLVQAYCYELVSKASVKGAEVRCDFPYGNGKRSPDLIFRYRDADIFMEIKKYALPLKTFTSANLQQFYADVDRILVDVAEQLSSRIDDYLRGEMSSAGFQTSDSIT